ncbi:MAG: helix-turn-helix domain-containing protein [Flavobacteriales bacterium]|nr:helix-turn-helix domain-containing protein [Flavobacteriales bacterium]
MAAYIIPCCPFYAQTMERGTILRKLRRNLDLTQQNIADDIGISQKQVSRIENDKSDPRLKVLTKYCEVLGITVRKLEKMCKKKK